MFQINLTFNDKPFTPKEIKEGSSKTKYKNSLEFASACDIDEKSIRRIFNGKQNFSILIFAKISTALETKMSELLSEIKL
jgi:transcriptional regulator with XRE-family HTH domain